MLSVMGQPILLTNIPTLSVHLYPIFNGGLYPFDLLFCPKYPETPLTDYILYATIDDSLL